MKRLLYPLIFSLSIIPDAEKHLEALNTIAQLTQESVKNIKSGLDQFQSLMIQFSQTAGQQGNTSKSVED